jgi:hypothetical protein
MKIDAISTIERSHIIAHLKAHGKWEGTRMQHEVRIVRYTGRDPGGNLQQRIQYSVRMRATTISDTAATAGAAIGEINALIAAERYGAAKRKERETPFVPRSGPSREYLPYKDA